MKSGFTPVRNQKLVICKPYRPANAPGVTGILPFVIYLSKSNGL